jgi:hypothetical protein
MGLEWNAYARKSWAKKPLIVSVMGHLATLSWAGRQTDWRKKRCVLRRKQKVIMANHHFFSLVAMKD